jgi:hypothetical protein
MIFNLLDSSETNYPADSLQCCPTDASVFAVGTYKLVENEPRTANSESDVSDALDQPTGQKRKREGQIHLYRVQDCEEGPDGGSEGTFHTKIVPLSTTTHPAAILDMRWTSQKVNGNSMLFVGDSIGKTVAYAANLDLESDAASLEPFSIHTPEDASLHSDLLALSLDISSKLSHSESHSVLVTYNTGSVEVVRLSPDSSNMESTARIEAAHALEAWTCCWDHHTGAGDVVFWTGGDDAVFRKWDLRVGTTSSVAVDRTSHSAGVTSLLVPLIPSQPYYLLSGSYDEHMYLWDTRFFKRGNHMLDYWNEGGGVWRIKMLPDLSDTASEERHGMTLAVAGMHRGFDMVQIGW